MMFSTYFVKIYFSFNVVLRVRLRKTSKAKTALCMVKKHQLALYRI